ncbi:hypothetical protein NK553_14635 [Pseudomonas sp. ZM23]|uniref:Phage tail protein n=1 Tax=Pseudomonas triclosanedens TaxID=2961893 RepID=A0ABY6ZW31_9PSED|nr:hypothetical protein [Pseudomonas triclosanedens]MCP8465186.1 hypothetical protein [Pseudomonas triclosanedens]MCP8470874.1 hypothetical protein [Pseudomonas triclosanedens]MCP8476557.1 hypothetical protein [Pseudomonas triclosanedens]WAI49058.1 hypothetical protein OU419_25465 [Pseudomonas triclosanedens]
MAVIVAQLARVADWNIDNPALTNGHDGFSSADAIPYASESARAPGGAPISPQYPVEANGRAVPGQLARSYFDDFYNRIHITPHRLDLGNLVTSQSFPVLLWNAYLEPRTLLEIDGTDEGLSVSGQSSPPMLFPALKELTWQLSVTPDGKPTLDTVVGWNFDNGVTAGIRVTANRIVAWSFTPDWGDSIIERLSSLTDIQQSESGVELRRSLRTSPRREFEAHMFAEGRERQLLDMALFGWGSRIWALPIWPDIQLLPVPVTAGSLRITCSTQHLDFRKGGLAMLRGETAFEYEVVQIEDIDATGLTLSRAAQRTWPARTRLYPARSAQLVEQPTLTRLTDTVQSAAVRFLISEVSDWPEVMPSTLYRGWPVLEQRPDENEDLTSSVQRVLSQLDNSMALPLTTDLAGRAFTVLGHRWIGMGRAERAAYRSLVYALRGQQRAVWVPTHADDLTLVSTITATLLVMDVANVGYTRFGQLRAGRRDIRIELTDGTALHRRIVNSTELSASVERLQIDSQLGRDVTPEQVSRICWLALCRSGSDVVEIEHVTDSEGLASSSLTFKRVRDDEF